MNVYKIGVKYPDGTESDWDYITSHGNDWNEGAQDAKQFVKPGETINRIEVTDIQI